MIHLYHAFIVTVASLSGLELGVIKSTLKDAVGMSEELDDRTSAWYRQDNHYRHPRVLPNWRVRNQGKAYWIELVPNQPVAKGYNPALWPQAITEHALLAEGVGVKVIDTRSALERLMSNV